MHIRFYQLTFSVYNFTNQAALALETYDNCVLAHEMLIKIFSAYFAYQCNSPVADENDKDRYVLF